MQGIRRHVWKGRSNVPQRTWWSAAMICYLEKRFSLIWYELYSFCGSRFLDIRHSPRYRPGKFLSGPKILLKKRCRESRSSNFQSLDFAAQRQECLPPFPIPWSFFLDLSSIIQYFTYRR
jgi:hypothetical protein